MTQQVLLVDDEPAIRHAVGRALRRDGLGVLAVATAGEALAVLEDAEVDAVLLDYHLPGMSGAALGVEIAARWPALRGRMLFVTGDPDLDPAALPGALGPVQLVRKPFDLLELIAAVHATLTLPADHHSPDRTTP